MCNLIGVTSIRSEEYNDFFVDEYGIGTCSREMEKIYRKFVDEFQEKSELTIKKVFCGFDESAEMDLAELENGKLLKSQLNEDGFSIYMVIEGELPSGSTLDEYFLDMSDYGFTCHWKDGNVYGTIKQAYDYGEYDTGYFVDGEDEEYINFYDDGFLEAESSICS
jgi:hypothetical protein